MENRWNLTAMAGLALLVTVLLVNALPVPAQGNSGEIQWMSYAEGRQRGEAEGKKVFLVFNADWCRYCLKMEKETFQNPTVIAYVNRNFIPVSVNSDRQQDIAAKYNVRGLPSTWFISESGDTIGSRPGYIAADEMLNILKYVGSDSYRSMTYKAFLKNNR
jgi:thioredoxin-related protein